MADVIKSEKTRTGYVVRFDDGRRCHCTSLDKSDTDASYAILLEIEQRDLVRRRRARRAAKLLDRVGLILDEEQERGGSRWVERVKTRVTKALAAWDGND